jgi:hypothetical protein
MPAVKLIKLNIYSVENMHIRLISIAILYQRMVYGICNVGHYNLSIDHNSTVIVCMFSLMHLVNVKEHPNHYRGYLLMNEALTYGVVVVMIWMMAMDWWKEIQLLFQ